MRWVIALGLLLVSLTASAQDAPAPEPTIVDNGTWVPDEDMAAFAQLVREQACLKENQPKFELDPITVIVDRQNRVYYTGAAPEPYKLRMTWCELDVEAEAKVEVQVAQREEPTWGFRFRPKAAFGILGVEAFKVDTVSDAFDGGILLEPFFIQWANFNAYVGVRSVGAGFGVDLTKNLGAYLGYAITWGDWRSNPFVAVSFAIW